VESLGPRHTSTLLTVNGLGNLYKDQGKLDVAEGMYMRALQGYEEALGPEAVDRYRPALNTMWNLGDLFKAQNKLVDAKSMLSKALEGFQFILGPSNPICQHLERTLASMAF
jgi:tetratricopeptide (TPR) repeat protein